MLNSLGILQVYNDTFRANLYTTKHFRMIGLIDVSIEYFYGIETVTLAFYSSSGTNNGKIKGLWYPIVGIKLHTGPFIEFTDFLNFVLTQTTKDGSAKKDWLAKSLFFYNPPSNTTQLAGFSYGSYYESLLYLGITLQILYENNQFTLLNELDAYYLNEALTTTTIYPHNRHTQKENYERLIEDLFIEL